MDTLGKILLITLLFPQLFLIELPSGGVVFGYYIVGAVFVILAQIANSKWPLSLLIAGLVMISTSVLHFGATKIPVLIFQLFTLALIISMTNGSIKQETYRQMFTWAFWIYVSTIILISILDLLNLNFLLPEFLYSVDRNNGAIRPHAFATESSYVAFLMVIMYQYLFPQLGQKQLKYLLFSVLILLLIKSLYGLILIAYLIGFYIVKDQSRYKGLWGILFVVGAASVLLMSSYILDRFSKLEEVENVVSLGSAGIRLLPWVYYVDIFNLKTFFLGQGAGVMDKEFFEEFGKFFTVYGRLSTHYIGFIFDYGIIPTILIMKAILPNNRKAFFLIMPLVLMSIINTGFSTYLFVLLAISLLQMKKI